MNPSLPQDSARGLDALGWNQPLNEAMSRLDPELQPARVACCLRGRLRLLDGREMRPARLAGRLRHGATNALDLPAVGDWVAMRAGGESLVEHLLPRSSLLVRQAAGRRTEPQLVAANVDLVGVVSSLDEDFNPQRLERYFDVVVSSGAAPLLILSKLDKCPDPSRQLREAEIAMPGAPIVTLSALEGEGVDALEPWLQPGSTLALIGSSGVGKSTLTNRLLGHEVQATGAVRESDGRGRHVTSHRELFPLPSGALLVDTPGMRELGAWVEDASGPAGFGDLAELAESCRFRDCSHRAEPGCAILAALESGDLDPARLESERKLQRERDFLARQQDAAAQAAEQAKWKAITKAMRSRPDR